jgi:hypothetical protein
VPEPSAFEVVMAVEKLKRHRLPGTDHIPLEVIKAAGKTICSEIHKLIKSVCNNYKLPEQWKESVIVPIYKKGDKTVTIAAYRSFQLHTKFYKTSFRQR